MHANRASAPFASLLLLLAGSCTQEPDYDRMSTAELLRVMADDPKAATRGGTSEGAARALHRRPPDVRIPELIDCLRGDDPAVARVAVWCLQPLLLGHGHGLVSAASRNAAIQALRASLHAGDEALRASSVLVLALVDPVMHLQEAVDERMDVLVPLLGSEVPDVRFDATMALNYIGMRASHLAPKLVARWKRGCEARERFAIVVALGSIGEDHIAAAEVLTAAIDDPEENVRSAAVSSVGRLGEVGHVAVPRLLRCVREDSELAFNRTSAASSLAELVRAKDEAKDALEAVRSREADYREHEIARWLEVIGRLAAKADGTEVARDVRSRLEREAESEDESRALVATSGLARIASAAKDVELGRSAAARLAKVLPKALADARGADSWTSVSPDHRPVLEALVELAPWEDVKVDAEAVRAVLREVAMCRYASLRAWAERELRKLH